MYSFNITILGEGHPLSPGWQGPGRYFNPPSPCGEGQQVQRMDSATRKFQSTLPVWGGTVVLYDCLLILKISIHPPRVGRDGSASRCAFRKSSFQSTLPVWGGTTVSKAKRAANKISIHPPRVGRDRLLDFKLNIKTISIHPPRVGRDILLLLSELGSGYFNPPSPCGEGRKPSVTLTLGRYFNPPSPCGEGLKAQRDLDLGQIFQSTLPVWGGTLGGTCRHIAPFNFNPPSPCGEGPEYIDDGQMGLVFQSTLPVWGGTVCFAGGRYRY